MDNYSTERQQQFMALVEPVYNKLERFCRAITRNSDEAKDILSETLLQAYQGFNSVRHNTAFLSFLFTIASRIHKKRTRRAIVQRERNHALHYGVATQGQAPDIAADIALLYDAIRRLPEKQREAIIMFELQDLPLEEIQRVQGGTLSAVKVRLLRARKKLATMLRPTLMATTATTRPPTTPNNAVSFASIKELL